MKKMYIFLALILMSGVIFAQTKRLDVSNLSAVKVINSVNSHNGDAKAVIDTLHYDGDQGNAIGTGAAGTFEVYAFFSAASLAAHNAMGNTITSIDVYINDITTVSSTTIKLRADQTSAELYTQAFTAVEGWNTIVLTTPFSIPTTDLYVGYECVALAGAYPLGCDLGPVNPNGNWIVYNSAWGHLTDLNAALTYNWNIRAFVDGTAPTSPTADCSPLTWNTGDILVGTPVTSGTFTLTNSGGGTLTASTITGVSAPFTTTFVPGSVNLGAGGTYTFTFTYTPTAAGSTNQTAVITTNGGNITINLTGLAHDPFGDMLGTFENIAAFDLVFPGWVQIDNDGSATYGFTGVTFTNSGYTGSFIAFDPAQTTPSLGTDVELAAHGGAKFGACISATTPPNDDWLITPQSALVTAGSTFKAWVKTYDNTWGLERYSIWVSTTNTNQASFTKISPNAYEEAPITWTEITYPLDAYVGQQIYVAVQCVSNDAFVFMLDDVAFNIVNSTNPVSAAAAISVFPNPTSGRLNIVNAPNATVEIYNVVGEKVFSKTDVNTYIDLSSFSNGTYVVKVITNNEVLTQKVNVIR